MSDRYRAADLIDFTAALFADAGVAPDRARTIAELLVEADLMGHTTHGLQLAPGYLGALAEGKMRAEGDPEIVSDRGAVATWDGHRLPGVWLTAHAIDTAVARARDHGTATIAIRRAHHIACLAAFLPRATDAGMMLILSSSDPSAASVAPYGGRKPIYTPDPIAVGIPTPGDPILIDISASITTNGMSGRLRAAGEPMPHEWLLDADGNPTDDPNVVFSEPPGSILPIGGLDHGHKGYGLALMIEAMTQALAGHGRADPPEGWGANVFVQVLDPSAFAGSDAFLRQTGWLADACRTNPPRPGVEAVRLPGQNAAARKRAALADGLELYPGIIEGLRKAAGARAGELPTPVA